MIRANRTTRNRACGRKRRHATREAAVEHMQRLVAEGASPDRLTVYPCKHAPASSPHFHVGHVGRREVES